MIICINPSSVGGGREERDSYDCLQTMVQTLSTHFDAKIRRRPHEKEKIICKIQKVHL